MEQYIRASRAEELGLVRILDEMRDGLTTDAMIKAIRNLPNQTPPSGAFFEGLLGGLDYVADRVQHILRGQKKA